MSFPALTALLPHAAPMVLIDRVTDLSTPDLRFSVAAVSSGGLSVTMQAGRIPGLSDVWATTETKGCTVTDLAVYSHAAADLALFILGRHVGTPAGLLAPDPGSYTGWVPAGAVADLEDPADGGYG